MSEIDDLIEKLKNPDPEVRKDAAWELGEIGDPSAAPALIEALKDDRYNVREYVAEALGKISDPSAVPALIEALKDDDGDVRGSAAWALGEIEKKNLGSVNLEDVQKALGEFVERSDENEAARSEAAVYYNRISEAVSRGRQRIDMPGEELEPRIPKKPKMFRGGVSRVRN